MSLEAVTIAVFQMAGKSWEVTTSGDSVTLSFHTTEPTFMPTKTPSDPLPPVEGETQQLIKDIVEKDEASARRVLSEPSSSSTGGRRLCCDCDTGRIEEEDDDEEMPALEEGEEANSESDTIEGEMEEITPSNGLRGVE
jgi:hypothetical protein